MNVGERVWNPTTRRWEGQEGKKWDWSEDTSIQGDTYSGGVAPEWVTGQPHKVTGEAPLLPWYVATPEGVKRFESLQEAQEYSQQKTEEYVDLAKKIGRSTAPAVVGVSAAALTLWALRHPEQAQQTYSALAHIFGLVTDTGSRLTESVMSGIGEVIPG